MSDEVLVGGNEYISSKRASQLTHYSQDYIGHLARNGLISAQRIGGLWYVLLDSLKMHQEGGAAKELVLPSAPPISTDPESFVGLDGKKYVSAGKAARSSGYNQDYVGQLARSGQILARQVGNRWYIDEGSVLEHKRTKDALLAAVQSESVGLDILRETKNEKDPERLETMRYFSDSSDLVPFAGSELGDGRILEGQTKDSCEEVDPNIRGNVHDIANDRAKINRIHIRVDREHAASGSRIDSSAAPRGRSKSLHHNLGRSSLNNRRSGVRSLGSSYLTLTASALTIVIVVSLGFSSVRSRAIYSLIGHDKQEALGASVVFFAPVVDAVELLLTKELIYTRND